MCPPPPAGDYDDCMAKKPPAGSPVPCPSCRADLPLYHPDPEGFVDCRECGRQPATPRAFVTQARATIEAATLRQADERAARMRSEAEAARRHARAVIQRNRERRQAVISGS